jgi:hypothetical protein
VTAAPAIADSPATAVGELPRWPRIARGLGVPGVHDPAFPFQSWGAACALGLVRPAHRREDQGGFAGHAAANTMRRQPRRTHWRRDTSGRQLTASGNTVEVADDADQFLVFTALAAPPPHERGLPRGRHSHRLPNVLAAMHSLHVGSVNRIIRRGRGRGGLLAVLQVLMDHQDGDATALLPRAGRSATQIRGGAA